MANTRDRAEYMREYRKNHREELTEYMRQYREKNNTKIEHTSTEKWTCDICSKTLLKRNKTKHLSSKTHLKNVDKSEDDRRVYNESDTDLPKYGNYKYKCDVCESVVDRYGKHRHARSGKHQKALRLKRNADRKARQESDLTDVREVVNDVNETEEVSEPESIPEIEHKHSLVRVKTIYLVNDTGKTIGVANLTKPEYDYVKAKKIIDKYDSMNREAYIKIKKILNEISYQYQIKYE